MRFVTASVSAALPVHTKLQTPLRHDAVVTGPRGTATALAATDWAQVRRGGLVQLSLAYFFNVRMYETSSEICASVSLPL